MNNNLEHEKNDDNNNKNNQKIENIENQINIIEDDVDDDEPFQIKYDRVVQKVKRVTIEDILKFSNLNNQNENLKKRRGRKSLKEIRNNEKKNLFIVYKNIQNNSNIKNTETKKHILNKKIKQNNFSYCVKSVNPNKVKKNNIKKKFNIKKKKNNKINGRIIELNSNQSENELEDSNSKNDEEYIPKYYENK